VAFFAGGQSDEVADFDLFGDEDVDAGEEVGERVLEGEGGGQAADAHGGEEWGDREAEGLEQEEDADGVDGQVDGGDEDGGGGEGAGGFAEFLLEVAGGQAGDEEGDGQDDEGVGQLLEKDDGRGGMARISIEA
jgi:hypothetical protein